MLTSGGFGFDSCSCRRRPVVPAGAADAQAVALLVDHVEFGQQVQALGHGVALVEAVGAFVGDRRVADLPRRLRRCGVAPLPGVPARVVPGAHVTSPVVVVGLRPAAKGAVAVERILGFGGQRVPPCREGDPGARARQARGRRRWRRGGAVAAGPRRHAPARLATGERWSSTCRRVACSRSETTSKRGRWLEAEGKGRTCTRRGGPPPSKAIRGHRLERAGA